MLQPTVLRFIAGYYDREAAAAEALNQPESAAWYRFHARRCRELLESIEEERKESEERNEQEK